MGGRGQARRPGRAGEPPFGGEVVLETKESRVT